VLANEVHLQYSGHYRSNPSAEAYIDTHIRYEVDCYSGRRVAERPIRFRLWHGSYDAVYIVRADDGNPQPPEGTWHLATFRQLPPEA
jgi:hypothetical protein